MDSRGEVEPFVAAADGADVGLRYADGCARKEALACWRGAKPWNVSRPSPVEGLSDGDRLATLYEALVSLLVESDLGRS